MIVHLTTVHPRFDTRIFTNEAKTLADKYGDEFCLLVADGLGSARVDGVNIVDLGKPGGGRLARFFRGSWRAYRRIRRMNAGIVHFHDPELLFLGVVLSILRYQVVYDAHEDIAETLKTRRWIPYGFRTMLASLMRASEIVAVRFFTSVVTVTPKLEAKFPPGKVALIRNYPRTSELRVANPVPYADRENKIVYVGALTKRRAAQEMIESMDKVAEHYRIQLILIGVFRPASLHEQLKIVPGWSRVEYLGWGGREDISRQFASARAGIVLCHPDPNHMDAAPVKMYEYMAAGLPVIAADFPAWKSQIGDLDCAVFVDPMDTDAIARAVVWILDHPEQAQRMGENGKRAIRERFNWLQESKKLLSLYDQMSARIAVAGSTK